MIKDAYYFSHDSNARFDPKILKLRAKFGLEGYGFYFCIIEIMRDSSDYMLNIDELDVLSFQLQIDEEKTKLILDFCLKIGLFFKDDKNIFSDSFLQRMTEMESLRTKRIEAGRKGGKAKARLKQNDSKNLPLKEKKRKEKKVNESIINKVGEFKNISLSNAQIINLKEIYKDKFDTAIETLSSYIASKGTKYKDFYAVLGKHNWVYKKLVLENNETKKEVNSEERKKNTEKWMEELTC